MARASDGAATGRMVAAVPGMLSSVAAAAMVPSSSVVRCVIEGSVTLAVSVSGVGQRAQYLCVAGNSRAMLAGVVLSVTLEQEGHDLELPCITGAQRIEGLVGE